MQKEDKELKMLRRFDLFGKIMSGVIVINYARVCAYTMSEYFKTGNLNLTPPLCGLGSLAVAGAFIFASYDTKKLEANLNRNKSKNLECNI